MIIYDNIIATLQNTGGISVLFQELTKRLKSNSIPYTILDYNNLTGENVIHQRKRLLERYRSAKHPPQTFSSKSLFHSTYYRLPTDKSLKTITTVHDFTYERTIKGIKRTVHSTQKNLAIRKSDHIICVSNHTKKDLIEFLPDIDASRISVVYNGASESYFPLLNKTLTNSVLFVGQRGRYKNFSSVVNALSMIPNIKLECVGGGLFSQSELLFLEKTIPGRYSHLGFLSESQLNSAYNRSLCLVYPSLYEGFGIPLIEAMRAGCPVIATNSSSIPEVVGNSAVLLEKGETDEIVKAIIFLQSEHERNKLVTLGIDQSKKFTWNDTYTATKKIYDIYL